LLKSKNLKDRVIFIFRQYAGFALYLLQSGVWHFC